MNHLRPESLAQDPLERLAEAAGNLWWALSDLSPPSNANEAVAHHWDVTPIHEAGHAVAATLAGIEVRSVRVGHPIAPMLKKQNALGFVQYSNRGDPHSALGKVSAAVLFGRLGAEGCARDMVATYAGPAAEIRHNPVHAASSKFGDFENAEKLAKWLDIHVGIDSYDLQKWAWSEACRMMADNRVWRAVEAIADRVRASTALPPRTSGSYVRTCVRKSLPEGWDWSKTWGRCG